ncbi:hypothetical protein [Streptomyces sp. TLI_105]|uniref:hypothetical protein n=1 Tax=Streptomyces sp. TLI_105 TaxID=1881019 RepID=UPI0008996024|nr:hypothetical protein [Streptomyces sp. TLI_105]SEE58634.1 hypothetical protein SAMN05428939_8001 [Streptomyces sp. TLI_105]
MTGHQGCGHRCCSRTTVRRTSGRRLRVVDGGRPVLTLVRDRGAARRTSAELSLLTREPMPADVRGALVTETGGRLMATWMPSDGPSRIPPGRILLSWTAASAGRTDVTAHLGLAGAQVLLAVWPGLSGEWSGVVRPTVAEVSGLHAALRLATAALDRLTD